MTAIDLDSGHGVNAERFDIARELAEVVIELMIAALQAAQGRARHRFRIERAR